MTVRHIFLWSVKDGHDGDDVLRKLASLEHVVDGILNWSIGRHEGTVRNASRGTWQYGLTCDVEDYKALEAYQNHPAHAAIVREVEGSYEDWAVVDYVIESSPRSRTAVRESPCISDG